MSKRAGSSYNSSPNYSKRSRNETDHDYATPETPPSSQETLKSSSDGGASTGVVDTVPRLKIEASKGWTTTGYVQGGTSNALNSFDLYNICCDQVCPSTVEGGSFCQRLVSTEELRARNIQAHIHDIMIVSANTNTTVSASFQYSGDGMMPSIINTGFINNSGAVDVGTPNETLNRPNFMVQRQHIQLPTTGSSTAIIHHDYDASPHNRPWFLTTDIGGRAYANIQAAQINPDGADAAWIAYVSVTFKSTQPVDLPGVTLRSNLDVLAEMKREFALVMKNKNEAFDFQKQKEWQDAWYNDKIERLRVIQERKQLVRLKKSLGIELEKDY